MLTLTLIASAFTPLHAQEKKSKKRRRVGISWRMIEGAEKYDLQISRKKQMYPELFRRKLDPKPSKKDDRTMVFRMKLPPGNYYYRVRGMAKGRPGPWSEVQLFAVNPGAPKLKQPLDGEVFRKEFDEKGIHFNWEEGIENTEYWIQIRTRKKVVEDRNVKKPEIDWTPLESGRYYWRVGFKTPGRTEWSKYRKFLVKSTALGVKAREKRDLFGPGFWIQPRFTFNLFTTSYEEDHEQSSENTNKSGSGTVLQGELNILSRFPRPPDGKWTFGIDFGLAYFASATPVATTSLTRYVFRSNLRSYALWGYKKFRFGPVIHLGYGFRTLYHYSQQNDLVPEHYETTRFSVGGGLKGVFQWSESILMNLGFIAEFVPAGDVEFRTFFTNPNDGSSATLSFSNQISWALDIEARLGLDVYLTEWMLLNAGIRVRTEDQTYRSQQAETRETSPPSSTTEITSRPYSSLYLLMDIGFSFKLF